MPESAENPYRRDRIAETLFVGRDALLVELTTAVCAGRNAIRAVMGGRGMVKSSLARQLQKRLGDDALTIITSGEVRATASRLAQALGVELAAGDPVEALIEGVARHPARRVAVVLDEVERVLRDADGLGFLDNLREAYERANGKLAVIVLGGAEVRDLLVDQASPFLRIAGGIHTLTGLARDEAATLLRAPLGLDVPDDLVDALWAETAGHPWLLQMFMEIAVDLAPARTEITAHLPRAMRAAESHVLHTIAFPIWWDNLRPRGQDVYRRLTREPTPVPRAAWVTHLGDDPRPWLDVLSSTGIVSIEHDVALARGALFRRWVKENHPEAPQGSDSDRDALDEWLTAVGVEPFERLVVRALAAWARATVEFPAAALRQGADSKSDNSALQPEAFFQMHAIVALLQHERELTAEPEALSMRGAGRSDIKVRSRHDPTQRACVEFKIFGRKDDEVVKQVIGYAAPGDTFAAVVSVDRCRRPLRPEFDARCFTGAPPDERHDAPPRVQYPTLRTEHARIGFGRLRVWHFLVQLRDAS